MLKRIPIFARSGARKDEYVFPLPTSCAILTVVSYTYNITESSVIDEAILLDWRCYVCGEDDIGQCSSLRGVSNHTDILSPT
jgi:hypothetical protein